MRSVDAKHWHFYGATAVSSQDAYIAQEIEEEAVKSLKIYQQKLLAGHNA